MPMPMELQHASDDFDRLLVDARDLSGLQTRNQTYTMVQGVLQAFRRRLSLADAIRFAAVLPPLLRAVFVADWDTKAPPIPFADREMMTREVQALRPNHNFAPDSAIRDVARALRKNLADPAGFDRMLQTLPEGAVDFWAA